MVYDLNLINLRKKLIWRCRIGVYDGEIFVIMWISEFFLV